MKLTTFAAVAILGMTGTSVAVWSMTDPQHDRTARPQLAATPVTPEIAEQPPQPAVDRSTFTAGDTLMMEGRLGHAVVPAALDNDTYVFIDVKADATKVAAHRSPLNLAIVIDRSGSMKGKRLNNALDAARTMVRRLNDGDVVSILTYNTRAEVVVPTTAVTAATRDDIIKRLRTIKAKGNTCISCGLETGMRLLGRNVGMINRILLLSDGEATTGVRDLGGFNRLAERCRTMGVSITSIGVDVDYNERIMAALARQSNGRHFFVENPDGLAQIFDKEFESLTQTIAANTEVTVELAPGVIVDQVFDRSFRRQHNRVVVPMGTFAAGEAKTLLMRVRVPRGPEGERPIVDVRMSYNDLAKGSQGTCDGALIARASNDLTQVSQLDGLVSARLSRSETAHLLEQANELFRSGRAKEARGLISTKRAELKKRRKAASAAAPAERRGDLDGDFAAQGGVLAEAEDAFEDPAPDAEPSRDGKAQVRRNQRAAVDLLE